MKKVELLAPCGDLERAKVAVDYGADAIYLGGSSFSLRSRASNFSLDDIATIVKYAHDHHVSVHVTVNMIPHQGDIDGYDQYLRDLANIGVDAIIVASIGVIRLAKQIAPRLSCHLSTQASVLNHQAVQVMANMGVDRVVLGREATLDEIQNIVNHSPIEIETFIHGGMCVNYSGRCTLSNFMTGRDANRGGCAQSCRWKYHLYDGYDHELSDPNHLFSMSAKDLCGIDEAYDLIKAGVASLKIEGRMKTAYYVATVVQTYRNLIDEIYATGKPLSTQRLDHYHHEIEKAQNRPFGHGFYHGVPDHTTLLYGVNGAGVTHDFVGVVKSIDTNGFTMEVRNVVTQQDTLECFGPHHDGIVVDGYTLQDENGLTIQRAYQPMSVVYVKTQILPHIGDMVRKVNTHDR